MFDRMISIARAKGDGVGFAEFGSPLVSGDDGTGRAAWLRSTAQYLQAQRVEFVTYWNDVIGDYVVRLLDRPSSDGWRSVMAAG